MSFDTCFSRYKNVTINRSLPGNKADMSPTVDDDSYNISKLYRFVKTLPRKDDGNLSTVFQLKNKTQKRKSDAQQTLHAAVNGAEDTVNIELSNDNIPQPAQKVNSKLSFLSMLTIWRQSTVAIWLRRRGRLTGGEGYDGRICRTG